MRILFSLIILVNTVYASIAVVSAFNGNANIYRDNQQIEVSIGIEIDEKDTIQTYNNSRIQLIFKDNTRITIDKNSRFSIDEYLYDESKPTESKAKFRFAKGLFRTISGRIGKLNKKQFKIRVKSSIIGIKGTKFDVYVSNAYVKVGVYKGVVYFENNGEQVDVQTKHFFVYEYLKDKKIIKKGKFKESYEFDEKEDESLVKEDVKNKNDDKKSKDDESEDDEESEDEENKEKINSELLNEKEPDNEDIYSEEQDNEELKITNNGPVPSNDSIYANEDYEKEIMDNGIDNTDIADLQYGYWQDKNNNKRVDTFITGTLTTEAVIDNYIANANTATYSGGISSIVTDPNGVKTDAGGTIILNIDFGAQSLNGDISINNDQYNTRINSGLVNSSEFSSSDIVNGASSQTEISSGTLNGNYYGTNGDSVGGSFTLNGSNNSKVEGVFGGVKQ